MTSDLGEHYQLILPYDRPPASLWANQASGKGGHWGGRSKDSRQVRSDIVFLGRQAHLPKASFLTVRLTWAPGDNRRRDEDNMWPFLKACCDGLARGKRKDWVGLELVPDDTAQYMRKLAPRLLTPDHTPLVGMWLDVWAVRIETIREAMRLPYVPGYDDAPEDSP